MSTVDNRLFFDDVVVGQQWQSPPRTVTEADIAQFAQLSGDFNPIHLDEEFAAQTAFRQRIAHGLLGLAIASGLGWQCPPMRTLAFLSLQEWHFRAPIFIGDAVHLACKVLGKEERGRGRRGLIVWQRRLINQEDKVVQEGVTKTLVEGRGKENKATD